MKTYSIKVTGIVQGVFFRAHTEEKARELGINGWVRNESDGSVYIEAQGDEIAMKSFIEWCHHGPTAAQVDKVIVNEIISTILFEHFETRY